jgi:hypothetical protein
MTTYRFGNPLDPPANLHDDHEDDRGERSALGWLSDLLAMLGGLVLVGSIAAAFVLAVHTDPSCGASTFYCSGTTHPWSAAAWAVGVGGSMQGILMIVVGLIGRAVEQMRTGLAMTYAEVVRSRPVSSPSPQP